MIGIYFININNHDHFSPVSICVYLSIKYFGLEIECESH